MLVSSILKRGSFSLSNRILSANLKLKILSKLVGLDADDLLNRDEEEHIESINEL
jgi:hypothetical protein